MGRSLGRVGAAGVAALIVASCALLPGGQGSSQAQARAVLARWADAVAAAGDQPSLVPVGELTGQEGDWEEAVGGNNKVALMSGSVEPVATLPADAPPDRSVSWQDGTTRSFRLMSAVQALDEIKADGGGKCSDCVPLHITGARLTTGPIETSRGTAQAPLWEFTVEGTLVRVTRLAVADRITVKPLDSPQPGVRIDRATGSAGSRQLTVSFVGAPGPGDKPCGADYSADAVESPTAIVVVVTEHPHAGGFEACAALGAARTAQVALAEPLGDRTVLDVVDGLPLAVTP